MSNPPVVETLSGTDSRPPTVGSRQVGWSERWAVRSICIFLTAIIWLVFGQTLGFDFVNYDDDVYVFANPIVQRGLTWEGFRWALIYGDIGHWHPLTWLSHMLDCQLYGLKAGGPHLTNVLLHTATTILLFLVLRRMTGFLWRSAFVAAVFAVHPLRAESAAWIAERKDVLSGLFFMLTIGAYVYYVRRPPSLIRYGLVVFGFVLGLMSKNMLVTLPFVLLLLDYWPLNRFSDFSSHVLLRLLWEKVPLFVLAAGSCAVTFLVPEKLPFYGHLPLGLRLENAVVSYVTYLRQMFYPTDLACLYPNPTADLPFWEVAGAAVLLLVISGVAWAFHKQRPWLVVGWLWYLGMMVPVIGIVQISYYAHADRYTYLPQIGLYLLLTWAVAGWSARLRCPRWVPGSLSVLILVTLMGCAHHQVSYWRNSELLWTHTLACTSDNGGAQNNLGNALLEKGNSDGAMVHFQKALQINPSDPEAHNNFANMLLLKGRVDEAITNYRTALQMNPALGKTYYNLGAALFQKGKVDEAIADYQKALQINPNFAEAHNDFGNALVHQGKVDEAIIQYQEALQINPDNAETHYNLGDALLQQGNVDEAIAQYRQALQIKPDYAEAYYNLGDTLRQAGKLKEAIAYYQKALQINAHFTVALNNLARLLATGPQASLRNGKQAVELAQQANQLTGNENPMVLDTLAAAYAEAGRYSEAVQTAQRALQRAETQPNPALAEAIRSRLKLYQAGHSFHSH